VIKTVTLRRKAAHWYVCLSCEVEAAPLPATGQSVGIDLGLTHFLTTDTGATVENPRPLKKARRKLRGLWDVFKGGKSGTLWYYRALVDAYRSVMRSSLIDELGRAVDDLERVAGERGPVEEGTASLPTDLFHVNPTDAPDLGIRNQD